MQKWARQLPSTLPSISNITNLLTRLFLIFLFPANVCPASTRHFTEELQATLPVAITSESDGYGANLLTREAPHWDIMRGIPSRSSSYTVDKQAELFRRRLKPLAWPLPTFGHQTDNSSIARSSLKDP